MNDSEGDRCSETAVEEDIRGLSPIIEDLLITVFAEKPNLTVLEVQLQRIEGKRPGQMAREQGLMYSDEPGFLLFWG